MSQEQLAEAIQVKATTYAAWEAGRNSPDDVVYLARKIEIITGVPASWVLGVDVPTADIEQVTPPTQPMQRVAPPRQGGKQSRPTQTCR